MTVARTLTAVRRTLMGLVGLQLTVAVALSLAGELFEYLDAPVKRVGALDSPVPYCPDLEDAVLPQSADILNAIRETVRY